MIPRVKSRLPQQPKGASKGNTTICQCRACGRTNGISKPPAMCKLSNLTSQDFTPADRCRPHWKAAQSSQHLVAQAWAKCSASLLDGPSLITDRQWYANDWRTDEAPWWKRVGNVILPLPPIWNLNQSFTMSWLQLPCSANILWASLLTHRCETAAWKACVHPMQIAHLINLTNYWAIHPKHWDTGEGKQKCWTWQMYLNAHLNVYFIFYAISIPSSYCHLCPVLSCGRHHGDSGTLRQLGQEIAKHLHLSRLNDFFGCENYHFIRAFR